MPLLTPNVPAGLIDLMKELAKEVLRDKPENIYEFAVIHFEKLIQQRDGSLNKGYDQFVAFDEHFGGQQLFAVPQNCGYTCQRPIHIQPIIQPKKSKSDIMAGFKAMESINEEDVILPENPYADEKYQNAIYVIQRFYRRYAAKKKNQTNPTLSATTAAIIIQRTMRRLFAKKIHPKPRTEDNAKQDGIAQDDVDNVSEAASYTSSSTIQMLADGQEGRENRLSGHEHEVVHSDVAVVVVDGADDGSTEFKEPTTVAQDEMLVPEMNSEVGAGPVEMDKKSMADENGSETSIHQDYTKHDHPTLDAPDDDTSTAPIGKLSTKIGSNDQQNSHYTNTVEIDSNSSDLTQIPTSVEATGKYSLNSTQSVGSTPDRIPDIPSRPNTEETVSLRLLGNADTDNNTANPYQVRKINVDAGESLRIYDAFYQDKDDPDFSDSLNESTMERDSLENEDLDVDSLELNEHVTHVSVIPKREVKEDDRILYGDGDTDEVHEEDTQDVQKTVELERVPTYLYGIHPSRTPLVEKKYKRNRSSPSAENRKVCDTNESLCVVDTSMTAEEEDESLESKESTSEESSATQIENLRVHKYDKLAPEEVDSMADKGESIKMHEEEISNRQKDQEINFEEKQLAEKQNLKSTDLKSSPEGATLTETKFDTLSERTDQKSEKQNLGILSEHSDFSEDETPRVLKITSTEGLRESVGTFTEIMLSTPIEQEADGTDLSGHAHIGESQLQVATIAHPIYMPNEDLRSEGRSDNSSKSGDEMADNVPINLHIDNILQMDDSSVSHSVAQTSNDMNLKTEEERLHVKEKDTKIPSTDERADAITARSLISDSDSSPVSNLVLQKSNDAVTTKMEDDVVHTKEENKDDVSPNFGSKTELAIPKITIQTELENDIVQDDEDEEPKKDLSSREVESSNDEKEQTIHRGKRSINVSVAPPISENANTETDNKVEKSNRKSDNVEPFTGDLVQNMEERLQMVTETNRDQINNENNDETTKDRVSTETQSNVKMQADDSRQQSPLDYFEALYGSPKLSATGDLDHDVEFQLRQLQSLSDLHPGLEIKDAISEYHTREIRPEERDDITNLVHDDNNNVDVFDMRDTSLGDRTLSEDRDSAKSLGKSIEPAIGYTETTDRDELQINEIMNSEVLKDTKDSRAEINIEDSNREECDVKEVESIDKIVKDGTEIIGESQNLIGQQLSDQINVTENSKSSNDISNENKLIWDTQSNNESQIMPRYLNEYVSNNQNQNTDKMMDNVESTSIAKNASSDNLESKNIEKAPSVHVEHCFGNPIDSETQSKVHPIVEILKLNDGTAQNVSVKLSKVDEEAHDLDEVEEISDKPTGMKGEQENYSIEGSNMTDDQANMIEGETAIPKQTGQDANQVPANDKMSNLESDITRANEECHTIDDNGHVKSESSKEMKSETNLEDESEKSIITMSATPIMESGFALKKVDSLIHIEGNIPQPENTALEKSNFSPLPIIEGELLTKIDSTTAIDGNLHQSDNTTFEKSNLTDGQTNIIEAEILNSKLRENNAGSFKEQSEACELFNLTDAEMNKIRQKEINVEIFEDLSGNQEKTSEPKNICVEQNDNKTELKGSQHPEEETPRTEVERYGNFTAKGDSLEEIKTDTLLKTGKQMSSETMSPTSKMETEILKKDLSPTNIEGNIDQTENIALETSNLTEAQANVKEDNKSILKPIDKYNEQITAESEVANLNDSEKTRMSDALAKKNFNERGLDDNHDSTETCKQNNEANNNITVDYECLDDSNSKSTSEDKNDIISDKVSALVKVNQETVRKDNKKDEIQENIGQSENITKPNKSKSIFETTAKDEMESQKAENMISKSEPTSRVIHDSNKIETSPITKEVYEEFSLNLKNKNDESDGNLKAAEDNEDGVKHENEQQKTLKTELLDENNQPALDSASSNDSSINKLKPAQKSNMKKSEDNLKSDQITENRKPDIQISAIEDNLKSDQKTGNSTDMIISEKNFIDKNTPNKLKTSIDSSDISGIQNDEDQLKNDKRNIEVKALDHTEIKEDPCLQDHGQFERKETIKQHNDQENPGVVNMDIKSCSEPEDIVVGRSGSDKLSEDKPEFGEDKNVLSKSDGNDESDKVQKTQKADVKVENDPVGFNDVNRIEGEDKQFNSVGSNASAITEVTSCEDSNADTSADFSSIGKDLDFFEDTISYLKNATNQLSAMEDIFSGDTETEQHDKQLSRVDKESELTLTTQTGQQMEAFDENSIKHKQVEDSKKMPKSVDLLDQAAVVIQSTVRGYQARKDIGKKITNSNEMVEVSKRKLSSGEIVTDQSLIAQSDDHFQKMNLPIALIQQNVDVTRSERQAEGGNLSNDKKLDHKIDVEADIVSESTSAEEEIEIPSNKPQPPRITREKPIEKIEKPVKDGNFNQTPIDSTQDQLTNLKESPIKRATKQERAISREKPIDRKPRTFKSDSLDETKSKAVKFDTLEKNSKPSISQPSSGRTIAYENLNLKMTDQKTKNPTEKTDAKSKRLTSKVSSTSNLLEYKKPGNGKQNQYGRKGKSMSVYEQKPKSTTFDLEAIKKDLLTTRKVKTPPKSGIKSKTVAIVYPRKKGEDAVGSENHKRSKIADSSNKSMNVPLSSVMLEQNNFSDHFEGIRDEQISAENKNDDSKTGLTNEAFDVDQHFNSKNADQFEEISDERADINGDSKLNDISIVYKNDDSETGLPDETLAIDRHFDGTKHVDNFEGTGIEKKNLKLNDMSAVIKNDDPKPNDSLKLDQHSDSFKNADHIKGTVEMTDSSRDSKSSDISGDKQNDDSKIELTNETLALDEHSNVIKNIHGNIEKTNESPQSGIKSNLMHDLISSGDENEKSSNDSEKEHSNRDFETNYNLNEKLAVVPKKTLAIHSENDKCEDDNVDSKLVDNLTKDIDSIQQMAATKIQKAFKGYTARKNLNESKTRKHISDTLQNDNAPNPKSNKAQQESHDQQLNVITKEPQETTESLDIFNNLKRDVDDYRNTAFDKSATIIQKNFRGYKTRNDMKNDLKKTDEEVLNKTFTVDSDAIAIEKLSEESDNHRTNAQNPEEESSNAYCKDKLDKSATTIQSNFRGYKTRKDMQNHAPGNLDHTSLLHPINSGNETAVEADKCLPTTDLSQNKMVEKVQEANPEEKSTPNESLGIFNSLKREVEDLKNNFLDKSATVIQKTFRGYRTRKAVQDGAVNISDNPETVTPQMLVKREVVMEKENEAKRRASITFDDISAKAIQNEKNELIEDDNMSNFDKTFTFAVTNPENEHAIETDKTRESQNVDVPIDSHSVTKHNSNQDQETADNIEQLDKSATVIQKTYRGYKTRNNLKGDFAETMNLEISEETPSEQAPKYTEDHGEKLDKSATTIQKTFRGYKTRKDIKDNLAAPEENDTLSPQILPSEAENDDGFLDDADKSLESSIQKDLLKTPELCPTNKEAIILDIEKKVAQEKSASTIQKAFRGYKTKKEFLENEVRRDKEKLRNNILSYDHEVDHLLSNDQTILPPKENHEATQGDQKANSEGETSSTEIAEQAALTIQKMYRGFKTRLDLLNESQINQPGDSKLATKYPQNEADLFQVVRPDTSSNTSSTVDIEKPHKHVHTEGSDLAKTVRATSACALLEDAASTIQKAYRDYDSRKENPIKSYSHGAQRENAVKETTTENSDESSTFIGPDTSFDLSDVDSVETKSTPTLVALDDEKIDDIELQISNSPSFAFTIPSEELENATQPKETSHLSVSPHGMIRKRSITDPTAPALDDILNAYESHKPQWYVGDDLIIPSNITSEPSSTHSPLTSSSSIEKLNSIDTRNEILNSNLQLTPSINSAVVSTSSLLFDPKETEMHANHNLKHLNNNSRPVSADKEDISKVNKEESISAEEKSEKERLEGDIFEDNGTIPHGLTNMGETLTITCTDPFSPRNVSKDAEEDTQVVLAELCKNCADGVHEVHDHDVEEKSNDLTTNVELDDTTRDQEADVVDTTDKHFDEIKQFVLMENIDSAVEHKESQKVNETSGNKNIDDNETPTLEKIHSQENSTSIDSQMANVANNDGEGADDGEKSAVAVKVVDQNSKEICVVEVDDKCPPSITFIPPSSEDDVSDRESIQEQQIICQTTSGVGTSIHDDAKVFEVGNESDSNKHEESPLKVIEKLESGDTCQEDVKSLQKNETNIVGSVKQLEEIGSNNLDDEQDKRKHDDNGEFKEIGAIASTSVKNNCDLEMVNESISEKDARTSNEIQNDKLAATENETAAETVKVDKSGSTKQNEITSDLEISEGANVEKYTTEENRIENDLSTEGLAAKDKHASDNADVFEDPTEVKGGDFELRANAESFNKNEILQHENAENVNESFINPSKASSLSSVKSEEMIQENSESIDEEKLTNTKEMDKGIILEDESSRGLEFNEETKPVTDDKAQETKNTQINKNSLEDKKTPIDQPNKVGDSLNDLQAKEVSEEERSFEQTSIGDTRPINEKINEQKFNLNKGDAASNCKEGNSESIDINVEDIVEKKAVDTLKAGRTNINPKQDHEDSYEKGSLEGIKEESTMPESIDDFDIARKLLQHSDSITEADVNAMLKSEPESKNSKQYSEDIKMPIMENIDPVDIVDNVKQEQEEQDRSVSHDQEAPTKREIEAKLEKLIDDAQSLNKKDETFADHQDLPTEDSPNEVIEQPCVKKIIPPTPLSATSDQDESELESTTTKADSTTTTPGYDGTSDNDGMEIPHSMPDGLEAVTEKLRETEATIARMQQRRTSEHKISIDQPSAFDEPICEPIRSMRELQKSSSTEVEDDIILQKLQRGDTTRESSAQSESIIFGDSQLTESEDIFNDSKIIHHMDNKGVDGSTYKPTNPLFKSVTIDDTVKYIDPEKSTEESGGSFCLDDAISADVRKKMMAYSISEADSDYYDAGDRTVRLHNDFNISTALDHLPSSDTDTTIVSAATKIQAGARGFLTRRRLRRASMGTKTSLTEETKTSFGNDAISESLEQLVEEEDAKRKSKVQYHRQVGVNSLPSALGNSTETEIVHLSSHEVIHVTDDSGDLKLPANLTTVMEEKITLPHGEISSFGIQGRREGNKNLIKSPSESDVNGEQETDDESEEVPPNLEATLAARRLTLQRGDAMRNDSTPDDENGNAKQVDTAKALSTVTTTNTSIHQSTLVESTTTTTTTVVATTTETATADKRNYSDAAMAIKLDKVKWFAMRQNSMPVQIDSEVFRVLPKHMRKRIKSAEGEKKKRIRLPRD